MTVQDDIREEELTSKFNLEWERNHDRSGTDAYFHTTVDNKTYRIDVETKSTTKDTVSTARDVSAKHIDKWRTRFWIIGFYTKDARPKLERAYCLTPKDMKPWIDGIKKRLDSDSKIADLAASKLRITQKDLFALCGKKDTYDVEDAKAILKQVWTQEKYKNARDKKVGNKKVISRERMLEIIALRVAYILGRGSTINNPPITKEHLQQFANTPSEIKRNWATKIQEIAATYIRENPDHGFPEGQENPELNDT